MMDERKLLRRKYAFGCAAVVACAVACSNNGGVSSVVQDFEQRDRAVEAGKRREADVVESAAEAIRSSIRTKLGMSDEAAAALDVAVMPNAKMLAGAKDKATGLCFMLGSTAGAWTVSAMGSTIDDVKVMAMGHSYGDGTFGSKIDEGELMRWAQVNCAPEGKVAVQ